jgi:release factor glutamine methyltransferase
MTVLELLQATTAFFAKHGIEHPRLNIEHLLADALGKRRLDLYLEFDRQLAEEQLAPLRERVRRRAEGEPLQHLLGSWEFFGRTFKTDPRALIPRPETERLVEIVLSRAGAARGKAVDVGTGSGVIAVTLALENPRFELVAIDIAEAALDLARENARLHGCSERIEFVNSDLLDAVQGPVDWLVANLPYVSSADLQKAAREVRHDPALALDGGPDGLQVIRRLIREAPAKLAPDACLALEVGHDQASQVAELFGGQKYRDICIEKDYQGVQRFVIARYG